MRYRPASVRQHAQQRAGLLARFDLLVDRFGDLLQPRAIGRTADHEGHLVLDPEDRADRAGRAVAQRALRRLIAAAIDGEALAGRALVHIERGGAAGIARQQPPAEQLQPERIEIGRRHLVADAAREPAVEMALAGLHLDRMAHLRDVEPMRLERLDGHGARRARAVEDAAAEPAGAAARAGTRRAPRRRRGATICGSARASAVELEARRHRLARDGAVARADRIGLRAPGGDARGILGMRGEPLLDRRAAVGRQARRPHRRAALPRSQVDSRSIMAHFTRRSAGRSPSR